MTVKLTQKNPQSFSVPKKHRLSLHQLSESICDGGILHPTPEPLRQINKRPYIIDLLSVYRITF